jgi:hypothetical protein
MSLSKLLLPIYWLENIIILEGIKLIFLFPKKLLWAKVSYSISDLSQRFYIF